MATLSFGGIDVSKDRLDVLLLPRGMYFSVRNDAPGWTELVARLRPFPFAAIGLEPSGGYERGAVKDFARVEPGLPIGIYPAGSITH